MANSTLLNDGAEAMGFPPGHTNSDLGPSDSSDTGSDRVGLPQGDSDSDSGGAGDRPSVDISIEEEGDDLLPDSIEPIPGEGVDEQEISQGNVGDRIGDAIPDDDENDNV
jgi:hypothetical protein